MNNKHQIRVGYDALPAMKQLRIESSRHNKSGNLTKIAATAGLVGVLAVNHLLGNPVGEKISAMASNAFRVDETPKEAVCTVDIKRNTWGIATGIAEVVNEPIDQVMVGLRQANPGVDLGVVQEGQPIGIPAEYAEAAAPQGCDPVVKPEQVQPK